MWFSFFYIKQHFNNILTTFKQHFNNLLLIDKMESGQRVFATNSDFLIPLSLEPMSLTWDILNSVRSEVKTLELDILNPDYLIWVSNGHTFDFLLKPFFLGYSGEKSKTGFKIF